MLTMTLAQILQASGGSLHQGGALDSCLQVRGLFTDTRKPMHDGVFVALRGSRFDAHDYLADAKAAGALLAVVEREVAIDLPQVVVGDSYLALGCIAAHWRSTWGGRMVGLTGSNGKTTTKEMLASIFSQIAPTSATRGNLNNEIGVPLTLAELDAQHAYAVIEMGANHRGEIAYLVSLARPDVVLVTNTGRAHIEGFGGEYGVVRGKGEIYGGLRAGGVALINADDKAAHFYREINPGRCLSFALDAPVDAPADVRGEWRITPEGGVLTLHAHAKQVAVELHVDGEHNARNALAAAAAALALGVDMRVIQQGLQAYRGVGGRLQRKRGRLGAQLWDDTYNANPDSLNAGLRAVVAAAQGAEVWLVLGDMGELGEQTAVLHADAGRMAHALGVQRLFSLGEASHHAVNAFNGQGQSFADVETLVSALVAALHPALHILVKGSRSARMERVVQALEESPC